MSLRGAEDVAPDGQQPAAQEARPRPEAQGPANEFDLRPLGAAQRCHLFGCLFQPALAACAAPLALSSPALLGRAAPRLLLELILLQLNAPYHPV